MAISPEPAPAHVALGWATSRPLPFWYEPIMRSDQWVHIMGTSAGQYDIFYGVIWGVRTAFKTGLIIVFLTLVIGLLVGALGAYYGGGVDNVLMRIVDIFLTLPFIMAALIMATILTPRLGRTHPADHDRPDHLWLDGVCPPDPRRHLIG